MKTQEATKSFAAFVNVGEPTLTTNACRFATASEASDYGDELSSRWFAVRGVEVRETSDPVNYTFINGQARPL